MCGFMCSQCCLVATSFSISPKVGLSFVNVDGGLGVFFPINSFVTNSTLTKTTKSGRPAGGNDHIACYGGDPQAAQVTWHDSGGGPLAVCLSNSQPAPCPACGSICGRNGAVGLDPPQQGHTDIHLFTGDPRYVNQDLQCRVSVSGGQSAFIGVYLSNRGGEVVCLFMGMYEFSILLAHITNTLHASLTLAVFCMS